MYASLAIGSSHLILSTYAEVFDGLRLARTSQIDRHNCPAVFPDLSRLDFIEWKLHLKRGAKEQSWGEFVEVAIVSPRGYAALDWLQSTARSSQWIHRQTMLYGE